MKFKASSAISAPVILPNFGSLFYTTVIAYKPLYGTPLLGLPVDTLLEGGVVDYAIVSHDQEWYKRGVGYNKCV